MGTWARPNLIIGNCFWVQMYTNRVWIKQKIENGSCSRLSCGNHNDFKWICDIHILYSYFDNFRTNGNQTRGIIEDLCRYCGSKQHWHTDPPRFEQLPPTHRPIYKRKKRYKVSDWSSFRIEFLWPMGTIITRSWLQTPLEY